MTLKHQQSLLQALPCTPAQLAFHWISPIPWSASRHIFWPSQAGKRIIRTADLATLLSYYKHYF